MKTKIKVIVGVLVFAFFLFAGVNVAHAEEVNENETVESTVEDVTTREMIKEFIDEWLIVILATVGGFAGTVGATTLKKKVIEKATEVLDRSTNTNAESNGKLQEATNMLSNGLKSINSKIEEFENKCLSIIEAYEKKNDTNICETMNAIINCITEIDFLRDEDSKFKELVALLVASNPQLASNGYATKILELLNEGSESNE
jgi:hypothetical protein